MLQHRLADVVAVELAALAGVRRRERRAVRAEQQPFQQGRGLRPRVGGALARALPDDAVDLVPDVLRDDRLVPTRIVCALVADLPDVDPVVEHPVEVTLVEEGAGSGPDTTSLQIVSKQCPGAQLEKAVEDVPHRIGFLRLDQKAAVLHPVTERDIAAHPDALLLGGRDLVADALGGDLTFELCKGQEDIEGQAAHRCGGIEGLRDGDEGHAGAVEHLHQLGEVRERPASLSSMSSSSRWRPGRFTLQAPATSAHEVDTSKKYSHTGILKLDTAEKYAV